MASAEHLSTRQLHVLEAVIQTYIETAEPAGSRTVAQRFGLGVSSATVRNIMSELEELGAASTTLTPRRAASRPTGPTGCTWTA